MIPEYTDKEILTLYKNGEEEIFQELLKKYTPMVFNFSARIVGQEEAKDITQNVFIKVWKNLKRFDEDKSSLKTWIITITKNTITDFLRKRKNILFSDMENNENEIPFSETIEDENPLPDEILQRLQDEKKLNDVLEKISILHKTILVLHYQENMTFDEIGKVLNKPLNTVKSYHRRAILELRNLF